MKFSKSVKNKGNELNYQKTEYVVLCKKWCGLRLTLKKIKILRTKIKELIKNVKKCNFCRLFLIIRFKKNLNFRTSRPDLF